MRGRLATRAKRHRPCRMAVSGGQTLARLNDNRSTLEQHLDRLRHRCGADFCVHLSLMDSVIVESLTVFSGTPPIRLGISVEAISQIICNLPDFSFSRLGRLIQEPFENEVGPFIVTDTLLTMAGLSRDVPSRADLLSHVLRAAMGTHERKSFSRRNQIFGPIRAALDGQVSAYRPGGTYQATSVVLFYYKQADETPKLPQLGDTIKDLAVESTNSFFAGRRRHTLYSEHFHRSLSLELSKAAESRGHIDPDDDTLLHVYAQALASATLFDVEIVDRPRALRFDQNDFILQTLDQGITTYGRLADQPAMCVPVRPYTVGRRREFERALLVTRSDEREFTDLDESLATQVSARLARIDQRRRRDRTARSQAGAMRVSALSVDPETSEDSAQRLPYGLRTIARLSGPSLAHLSEITSAHSVSFRVLAPSVEHVGELDLWQVGYAGGAGQSRISQGKDRGANWRCATEGRKVYVPSWEHSDLPVAHRSGTRSSLTVPVYSTTALIGTINCESHRDSDFLEHVTDIVNCANLLGQAHDLTRIADWTTFVQKSSLDVNLLHNLANRVSILGRSLSPDSDAKPQLIAISQALREFYEGSDLHHDSIPTTLESLLEPADDWARVGIDRVRLLGPARPLLRAIVDELLFNYREHGLEGERRIVKTTEVLDGESVMALRFQSLSRNPLTASTVDRLFKTVNPNGFDSRNRVGTAQCGWLATLLGGRIDAWKGHNSRELHVVLRVPNSWITQ